MRLGRRMGVCAKTMIITHAGGHILRSKEWRRDTRQLYIEYDERICVETPRWTTRTVRLFERQLSTRTLWCRAIALVGYSLPVSVHTHASVGLTNQLGTCQCASVRFVPLCWWPAKREVLRSILSRRVCSPCPLFVSIVSSYYQSNC